MPLPRPRAMLPTVAIALAAAAAASPALAWGGDSSYAEPPPGEPRVAIDDDRRRYDPPEDPSLYYYRHPVFRLSVGPAARATSDSLRPGLFAAFDVGRGPAGFRMSGAWVRVGYDDPLQQYAGELTLDLGSAYSPWRPSVGVGAGIARTYAVDETGARTSGGSSIGIGVARLLVEYRLPLEGADARAGAGVMASLPAVRASNAPDLGAWAIGLATVSVGF